MLIFDIPTRVHPLSAETTVSGSGRLRPDQVTRRASKNTNGNRPHISLGIYLYAFKPVKALPFSSALVAVRSAARWVLAVTNL